VLKFPEQQQPKKENLLCYQSHFSSSKNIFIMLLNYKISLIAMIFNLILINILADTLMPNNVLFLKKILT